jgi:hypothetical protein
MTVLHFDYPHECPILELLSHVFAMEARAVDMKTFIVFATGNLAAVQLGQVDIAPRARAAAPRTAYREN